MREPYVDFAHLKRVVSITDVLADYNVLKSLRPSGSKLVGPCPLHGGRNRSAFVVDPSAGSWICFSSQCRLSGGILEFVAEYEKISIAEAAQLLSRRFAVAPEASIPRRRKTMSGRPSHKVFTVEDRQGDSETESGFWTRIGSAWPHKDGKGLNVVLQAFPVNGRLVLREFEEDGDDDKSAKSKAGRR